MSILLKGGLVFDGKGTVLDGQAVLVNGETIERVAPAAEFDGFAGEIIDTSGGMLLPGIIDCHVHLCYAGEPSPMAAIANMAPGQITMKVLDNAQTSLAGGVTGVRDCGGKDYNEFAVRDACNSGRQLGPTIRTSGRVICMTGGHGNQHGRVADGIDEVVKAVREQIHAGADVIKLMATGGVMTPGVNPEDAHYSPEELKAAISEGHRFHKTCASHAQGGEGILNAVRGGIDSIEHGIFMDERCVTEMIEAGTYLVPTLAAVRNILAHKDKGVPPWAVEKCERVAESHRESIKMFYEAGGKIAMGTDAGTPFNYHGENALELAYMNEIGIAPIDALRMSTCNGADLMRLEKQGSIADGMIADLLVVDGNPVDDIQMVAEKRNHRMVIKSGKIAHRR